MVEAYQNLHDLGHAHSVECWQEGKLVGGLYGVSLGAVFFGESMFSLVRDSSKVALAGLVDRLQRLGAREIPGEEFSRRLARAVARPGRQGKWSTA